MENPLLRVVGYQDSGNDELFKIANDCKFAEYEAAGTGEAFIAALQVPAKIIFVSADTGWGVEDDEPLLYGKLGEARIADMRTPACEGLVLYACWSASAGFWSDDVHRTFASLAVLASNRVDGGQTQNTNGRPVLQALIRALTGPLGSRRATEILRETWKNADALRPGLRFKIADNWEVMDPDTRPTRT